MGQDVFRFRFRLSIADTQVPASKFGFMLSCILLIKQCENEATGNIVMVTDLVVHLRHLKFDLVTLQQIVFALFSDRWNQVELTRHRVRFLT